MDLTGARTAAAGVVLVGDALKKTRDAAVFLTGRYHDQNACERTHFAGGSTGGREALAVAQRWERDLDGVISDHPACDAAALDLFACGEG